MCRSVSSCMADTKDIDALASGYVEFLKGRFSKTIVDWTPVAWINKPAAEYMKHGWGDEILISSNKALLKNAPKLRFMVVPLKTASIQDCMNIIEKIKPILNLEVYTVIVFVGHQTPKTVVDFVEGYNNDSSSLFLAEPGTGEIKFDYKSITKNYFRWLDFKKEPISTKERLMQLSEKSGGKNILSVIKVREEYNFTHGQALDFLHSCKFLKRDGLTENYIFR